MTAACRHDCVLVVDIGGTKIKFGYSVGGQPGSYRKLLPTVHIQGGDTLAGLATIIEGVIAESGMVPATILMAVPGLIDVDRDRVLYAENVPGLQGRRLATELSERLGRPVIVERDAILLLMGEAAAGAARDRDNVLGIFFGTGIGAAFIHQGKPFRGAGWALEVGLMPVMCSTHGAPGVTANLEDAASGRALVGIADRHRVHVETIFRVSKDNEALRAELTAFVRYQAMGVAMIMSNMSPATVVLGGGVLKMPDYPSAELSRLICEFAFSVPRGPGVELRWCEHDWSAMLYGAASIALQSPAATNRPANRQRTTHGG